MGLREDDYLHGFLWFQLRVERVLATAFVICIVLSLLWVRVIENSSTYLPNDKCGQCQLIIKTHFGLNSKPNWRMQGENNKNYAESYYLNEHHHVNYFLLKFVNKERSSLVDYFRSEIWYSVITPDILNLNKVACAALNEKKHIFTQNSMINELLFQIQSLLSFPLNLQCIFL